MESNCLILSLPLYSWELRAKVCEGLAQISALGLGNVCLWNPLTLAFGALLPQDRTEQSRQDILLVKAYQEAFQSFSCLPLWGSKSVVLF